MLELARYVEAEQVLRLAVQEISGEHLDYAYTQFGKLYEARGDYDKAEAWYRKAVDLNPDHSARHIVLGALLAKKGDFPGAETCHRSATRCSKGDLVDEAFLNLGLVLRAQDRHQDALVCFERALELDANYREALIAKADVEKAIAYLQIEA